MLRTPLPDEFLEEGPRTWFLQMRIPFQLVELFFDEAGEMVLFFVWQLLDSFEGVLQSLSHVVHLWLRRIVSSAAASPV